MREITFEQIQCIVDILEQRAIDYQENELEGFSQSKIEEYQERLSITCDTLKKEFFK